MQSTVLKRLWLVLAASTIAASFFLAGCEGDDGEDGRPGRDAGRGPVEVSTLTTQQQADLNVQGEVQSVSITNGKPVVRFKLTDNDGDPILGLDQRNAAGTQLQNFRFVIAKLVPGTNGSPSQWVNYLVASAPSTATPPAPVTISRPGTGGDREGTLVDNGDGTYTYTFARDITQAAAQVNATTDSGNNRKADLGDLTYDPNLTHRLVVAYSGTVLNSAPSVQIENPLNLVYDFIPATGAKVAAGNTQREIVLNDSCKECHGSISSIAHSFADDTRFCVTCHTPQRAYGRAIVNPNAEGEYTAGAQTYVSSFGTAPNQYTEVMGDFTVMIHKIHQDGELFRVNYNYAGVEFDKLGYPQSAALCRKCHREDAAAPQANNWFNAPNRKGCGSCHDNILFSTGVDLATGQVNPGHTNATDISCRGCHNPTLIRNVHARELASPLNPDINPELTNFRYDIQSATVDPASNDLTIKFRILSQTGTAAETPVTFVPAGATVTAPLQGFTGSPSFLLGYARPQIGFQNRTTAMPIDYNNLGATSGGQPIAGGQPASISITQLLTGARGTLGARDANGYYTATIPSANAFPRGATMRAVTLQGYFTQPASGTIEAASGRHTIAVVRAVQGDLVRRTVVDPAKCARCHEYFEAHGGNRVYETQMCVFCHNPNLTTSGRTLTDAQLAARLDDTDRAILTTWDFDFAATDAALGFPETSNNFKEMIHGIHAGGTRTDAFRDVRNGSGTNITIIDAEEFVFPNMLKNCEACHITPAAGAARRSYDVNLPANVLPTTMVTQSAATGNTPASITAARLTVPNPEDLVVPPITGSCVSCHDSAEAVAHIQANGGQLWNGAFNNQPVDWTSNTDIGTPRRLMNPASEQCVLCHGPGRVADVDQVHETDVDADDDDL